MAVKRKTIGEVVDLWYLAGLAEKPWSEPLVATAELLGGVGSAFFDLDRATGAIGRFQVHRLERGAGEYVAHMNSINPRMRHSLSQPGPHVVADYGILPEAAIRRSEFYDWMERTNDTRFFVGGRLVDRGQQSLFASVEFSRRHGHADESTIQVFRTLAPHIANAWRVSGLLDALDETHSLIALLARQSVSGIILLSTDGTVLFANDAAERVLDRADGLFVASRRLRTLRAAVDRTLQRLVARVLGPAPEGVPDPGGIVAVPRASGRLPYVLRVLPCGSHRPGRDGGPAALVLIADPDQRALPSTETLSLLGLSAAESRVARMSAQGFRLPDIAAALGISHNTARAHLRSIFAKTGARSQPDLVRMLGEFARLAAQPQ
jgi:DNA-binding CsgD family transcriptional regulator